MSGRVRVCQGKGRLLLDPPSGEASPMHSFWPATVVTQLAAAHIGGLRPAALRRRRVGHPSSTRGLWLYRVQRSCISGAGQGAQ